MRALPQQENGKPAARFLSIIFSPQTIFSIPLSHTHLNKKAMTLVAEPVKISRSIIPCRSVTGI